MSKIVKYLPLPDQHNWLLQRGWRFSNKDRRYRHDGIGGAFHRETAIEATLSRIELSKALISDGTVVEGEMLPSAVLERSIQEIINYA